MKNSKLLKKIAASIVCSAMALTAFGMSACNTEDDPKPNPQPPAHTHTYSNTWSSDGTNHWHDATCGHDVKGDEAAHKYVTGICNVCGTLNHDATYYTALSADDINNDDSIATYEDETGTPATVAAPKVVANTGNGAALVEGNITSVYEFDAADLDTKSYANGWTDGIFSIANGTEVRGRIKTNTIYDGATATNRVYETKNSVKLDGTGELSIKVSSTGTLEFYVLNGSSGTVGTQSLTITSPSGSTVASKVTYPANGNSSNIQLITLNLDKPGTYTIARTSGTSDIYYAKFTTSVSNTPIQKINLANTGKTEYLVGQQLDCTDIAVTATHADTGRISLVNLENLVLDTSNYNPNQAGTYTIGVSYTVDGNLTSATTTFTTSYTVKVYDFDDFTLSLDKTMKESKNSAAGNGVYATHNVRQYYFVGDTFSYDGLSIIATGKLGNATKKFALDETQAVITGNSTATAGKQSVKVAYTANGVTKAKGFNIYVAEKDSELATADYVNIAVNPEFSSKTVGTLNAAGAYRFKTIQQALDFINASGMKADAKKNIFLAEGTYWEKLEVTAPNVAIIGAGQEKTKIEYNALYGVADASGFVHVTDSTATLNVRDTAVGFSMENLTVSNYYNTLQSYNGAPSNDKRALAMLIQADKVVIKDSTLLGFQDTLELFTGRQIFENCLISGSVDFIFGTNNVTYFHKCEIKVVANGSNGGYVTAFKGLNKGKGTDDVNYGTVFDDCDFTAESGVPNGKTAIGRAWGATAAVMVMNSRLGNHISKSADTNSGGRYISMGNGDPKDARFTEYNNTGAGAISANLATVDVLEETAASKYNDLSFIFGKNANKLVTFADVWNPYEDVRYPLPGVQKHLVTVCDNEGNVIGTLNIEEGTKVTLAQITGLVTKNSSYADKDVAGVYSNQACTDAYTYPEITAAGSKIYVGLEEGPIKTSVEYDFKTAGDTSNNVEAGTEGTQYIGKLHVDVNQGEFVNHNGGDWYRLTGDATLSLILQADTRVTVTDYDDSLKFTFIPKGETEGTELTTWFGLYAANTYTIDVREAGTLAINAKGSQAFVGHIAVTCGANLSNTKSTVTVYSEGTSVTSFQLWNGEKVSRTQLDNIKAGVTAPDGTAFAGYYSDAQFDTAYDFADVSADTPIYIKWEAASDAFDQAVKVTFGTAGNYKDYLGGKLVVDSGAIVDHAGSDCEIPEGTSFTIKVKQGATVTVSSYNDYTYYNVQIDGADYGDAQTGTSWTYTATADCSITFVGGRNPANNHSNYFYYIEVSY